ncbi:MAG TPA: WD40 repeat domain-containing protein [Coleofasciculaceae cyanobacterium]
MTAGLSLLVKGVLEFAPLMVALVQKRHDMGQSQWYLHQLGELPDLFQRVNAIVESSQSELSFEQEKKKQQQLAAYSRETQLKLAAYHRETMLQLPETQKILDNWPLRLYPSQLLASDAATTPLPLRIFLAFPSNRFNQDLPIPIDIESRLAQGLRDFLSQHYPLQNPTRPTEFLAGAWENQRFHSEASIKALFGFLKSEPTLILESDLDGPTLNFRVAYWGPGQETYSYKTMAQLPYRALLHQAAKKRALAWREVRAQMIALGEDAETVDRLGGQRVANLKLLEKEEQWCAQGIDVNQLDLAYTIDPEDLDQVCQLLIRYHCLVAAWIADTYHLVDRDVPPLLPSLLSALIQEGIEFSLLQAIVAGYQQVYQALEAERRYWVPELALQLAQSLSQLPDKTWAQEQVEFSLTTWLQLRQVSLSPGESPLAKMQSLVTWSDLNYLEMLKECVVALGDGPTVTQLETLVETLQQVVGAREKPPLSPALMQEVGFPIRTLAGHSGEMASLALSPAGDTLASCCLDKTLQVWNLTDSKPLRTLKGHGHDISSVAISPDGQFLASSSLNNPKSNVRIWNLQTGKLLHDRLGHQKSVRFVAMDGLGRIVSCSGDKVKIWDIKTGDRLLTLSHLGSVTTMAISPDSGILATGSSDGKIRLWNAQTGDPIRKLRGHTGAVNSLRFGPDGETLISASSDQLIRIWHLATGDLIHTLSGHAATVNAIAVAPDRGLLISGSSDTTLKFWKLDSWELLHTLSEHKGAINSLALSANGQVLTSGSADKTVKLWQL